MCQQSSLQRTPWWPCCSTSEIELKRSRGGLLSSSLNIDALLATTLHTWPVTCHSSSASQSLIINKHSCRLIEINAWQRRRVWMLASGEIGLHTFLHQFLSMFTTDLRVQRTSGSRKVGARLERKMDPEQVPRWMCAEPAWSTNLVEHG